MAEVLLSPGVLARENDQSFLTQQPVQAGAAILGPTVKGPVGIPTIVTTYSDYKNVFGAVVESGSNSYTFLTSVSAYNYFQQGGDTLLVTRIVSASSGWEYATSTTITNNVSVTGGSLATGSATWANTFGTIPDDEIRFTVGSTTYRFIAEDPAGGIPADASPIFFLETGSSEANYAAQLNTKVNDVLSSVVSASNVGALFALSGSSVGTSLNGVVVSSGSGAFPGGFGDAFTFGGGAAGSGTGNAFTLKTLSKGETQNSISTEGTNNILPSGSKDNIRWEIVSPNTASGTFSLLIRRGDDNIKSKTVLETWADLSLDPNASNYIEKVIGNSYQAVTSDNGQYYLQNNGTYNTLSRYVRVSSVNSPTLNYFDNNGDAKSEFTTSIPIAGSGSFESATGTNFGPGIVANFNENISTQTQGLVSDDYTTSLNLLSNRDEFRYNLIVAPGLTKDDNSGPVVSMIDNAQSRGDNLAVIDLKPYDSNLLTVTSEAAGIDSSYAATYWPWLQTIDPDLGTQVWVPASTMIPGVYAFNDNSAEAWFAPAGLSRGGLSTVLRAERKLTNGNRDTLYQANVNPIATFPNAGVVVFGQKTLQKKASALDRVNVRRLLIELKSYISQVADNLVFEQNTLATRNNFLGQVNPYLESVQQRQGLYAFKVVMDDSNNTPDVIDRNQMVGQIYLQPTKTAEFIYLDFNILPTGATFPA